MHCKMLWWFDICFNMTWTFCWCHVKRRRCSAAGQQLLYVVAHEEAVWSLRWEPLLPLPALQLLPLAMHCKM